MRKQSKGGLDVDALYRLHRRQALAVAIGYLRDAEQAQDALHEAFLKVQRHGDRLEGLAAPVTWLCRIVANVCVDRLRKTRRLSEVPVETVEDDLEAFIADTATDPEAAVLMLELRRVVSEGLKRLSERHRDVIVLREYADLTYQEIAVEQGCPPGTVMSRLLHARRKLRRVLERRPDYLATTGRRDERARRELHRGRVHAARSRPVIIPAVPAGASNELAANGLAIGTPPIITPVHVLTTPTGFGLPLMQWSVTTTLVQQPA